MAIAKTDADAHILVIVDTQSTIKNAQQGKDPVVYLVDDDPTDDSGQGSLNLVTHISASAKVTWKPTAINNDDSVELTAFDDKGPENFFSTPPAPEAADEDHAWTGIVGDLPTGSKAAYGFYFSINGQGKFYFDPELEMKTKPTET